MPGPITSLEDRAAEIGMVDTSLIKHLNLPVLGKITTRPVVGESVEADLVALKIKPCPGPRGAMDKHCTVCRNSVCNM